MRISDWSSDVCSSDLKAAMMVGSLGIARAVLEKDAMAALRAVAAGAEGAGAQPARTIDGPPHGLDDALRPFARGDFDLMAVGRMMLSNPASTNRVRSGDSAGALGSETSHPPWP